MAENACEILVYQSIIKRNELTYEIKVKLQTACGLTEFRETCDL